jgi:serine/threonine protein phosphatase PrpC
MLKYTYKAIKLHKAGNVKEENEDNFKLPITGKQKEFHFAISDGATISAFSKEWSELLAKKYDKRSFDETLLEKSLSELSSQWFAENVKGKSFSWYAEQAVENGAFATFLGLTIDKEKAQFSSIAIGDCCLFQVRKEKLFLSFPVKSSKDFCNTPDLIATNRIYQRNIDKVQRLNGELNRGDILLLATDALSEWILKQVENNKNPWKHLDNLLNKRKYREKEFEKWANETRDKKEIKNDDITLIIIKTENAISKRRSIQ